MSGPLDGAGDGTREGARDGVAQSRATSHAASRGASPGASGGTGPGASRGANREASRGAAWNEQHDQHGDRDDLSGRGMVNEAPENGTPDELALRRLLQGAVAGLEPSEGALDHLRRAVPARRVRKRQALVGVAAAVVLVGTAVPALVHVASSGGVTADKAVNAGHGEQAQGGTGTETGIEGGQQSDAPAPGTAAPSQGEAEGAGGKPTASAEGPGGSSGGETAPSGAPEAKPVCEAGQLGISSVQTGAPDASGKVYGTFRIANVSTRDCVVGGSGQVGFEARGAADGSRITVVEHTSGDAASALPDPSQEAPKLLLTPDNAYEVRFAWVPSETCPTTGPEPTPTPSPSTAGGSTSAGTGTTGSTGSDSTDNAATTQLATDGGPADGSVEVTHTADPGGPVAAATIPNACAGTIYRTGVLDAS
ncbi:hypothetical protein [Streptomyces sp. NPDC127092]|uniref:hypothetical protein n=1 Tax=Streptomyces sp. NPDC127092 TaxID=3347135 RepID=UPI0036579E37